MEQNCEILCNACPRNCNIARTKLNGFCGTTEQVKLAKAFLHKWEEPCISGKNGSGTIFFSGCNLKCVFCQNYHISQEYFGKEVSSERLEEIILYLQSIGAHNINFVSPSHYILQLRKSLLKVRHRLKIPVIYNSNGYDKTSSLKLLEGLVSVYLPDIKYFKSESSLRYSGAANYFDISSQAVLEMYRQTGKVVFDEEGMITKGLIIRHLVLPGMTNESIKILDWIKSNLPTENIMVSLMSQYTPFYKTTSFLEIDRRLIRREYDKVINHFIKLGFENGYIQERDSSDSKFIPDFNLEGI
ncbi:MAG: radical SAM protein [Bacillota bacterium]|nr:radical SAM protein [Bacillota bacterium]